METDKLNKLIRGYHSLDAKIKAADSEHKALWKPQKDKLLKAQALLQTVIHKDNEDGMAKACLPDGSLTAYARYEDKPKLRDRDELIDDYILEGVPEKYGKMIKDKLAIFSNTLVRDPITDFRLDSGAEEENGRLVGGALPAGVGLYTHKDVRIVRGSK